MTEAKDEVAVEVGAAAPDVAEVPAEADLGTEEIGDRMGTAAEVVNEELGIPEKVIGLERLAKAGLPVPEIRYYLPASVFQNGPPYSEELIECIKALRAKQEKDGLSSGGGFVRSAHPMEHLFSGGAMETYPRPYSAYAYSTDNGASQPSLQWSLQKLIEFRDWIVEQAYPVNCLRIRRDLMSRGIEGFDPEEMGVFVNERVPYQKNNKEGKVELVIVPLEDGRLSVRFFGRNYKICAIEIPSEGEVDLAPFVRIFGFEKISVKDISQLVQDIQKGQTVFEEPQEQEIIMDIEGQHVFVQSKRVEPESLEADDIQEDQFDHGLSTFIDIRNSEGKWADKVSPFTVQRPQTVDQSREMRLLIIDEEQWLIDAGIYEPVPGFMWNEATDKFSKFLSRTGAQSDPDDPEARHVRAILIREYHRLLSLAEQHPHYTLWVRNFSIATDEVFSGKVPELEGIDKMREELMDQASVQLRGGNDYFSGQSEANPHVILGANAFSQIGVYYLGFVNSRYPQSIGEHSYVPDDQDPEAIHPMRAKLMNAKDGDRLRVMVQQEPEFGFGEPGVSLLLLDDDDGAEPEEVRS